MKPKLIALIRKFGTLIFITIFLLIGLKSCYKQTISIDDYILLKQDDKKEINDGVILTPNNELIIFKGSNIFEEHVIYNLQGVEATHYISALFSIGDIPFGFRVYPGAEKVYICSAKIIQKRGERYPDVGESINILMIKYKDKMRISDHECTVVNMNDSIRMCIKGIINQLKLKETN